MINFSAFLSKSHQEPVSFSKAQKLFLESAKSLANNKQIPFDKRISSMLEALTNSQAKDERINMSEEIINIKLTLLKIKNVIIGNTEEDLNMVVEEEEIEN